MAIQSFQDFKYQTQWSDPYEYGNMSDQGMMKLYKDYLQSQGVPANHMSDEQLKPYASGEITGLQVGDDLSLTPIGSDGGAGGASSDMPTYTSILTGSPESGYMLPDEYSMEKAYQGLSYGDGSRLRQAINEAQSTSPSNWFSKGFSPRLDLAKQTGLDQINRDSMGATEQAKAGVAQAGGLRSGAAERIDTAGMENRQMLRQMLGMNIEEQRLDALAGDYERRQAMLPQLLGIETERGRQKLAASEADTRLQERERERIYQSEMRPFELDAAKQGYLAQAEAIRQGGGSDDSFIKLGPLSFG